MLMAADSVNSCATADAATASTRTNASARALMPRIIRSRSGGPALLDDRESPVYEEDQDEQEHSQRDGRVEVALARLEHHRRGQRTRVALDVAADHQRGADLGDDGTEAGHDGGQHRQPSLPQHDPHHLSARGAERDDLETERLGKVPDGGEQPEGLAESVDEEIHSAARRERVLQLVELAEDEERAVTDASRGHERRSSFGGSGRARVDLERQVVLLERARGSVLQREPIRAVAVRHRRHLTIRRQRLEVGRATLRWLSAGPDAGREDQEQRDADDHLLSPTSASFIPATGTNNGEPNFSRPKVLITRWVSGATMKSAKALPPAVFTRGPLAGFTSSTE